MRYGILLYNELMNIGIDLDEVVGDTMNAIVAFHNEKYGTTLRKREFSSYRFWEIWGGTRDEAIRKMYDFFETDHFKNINPVFGSLHALEWLKKDGHKIFLITGRQNHIIKKTEEWIERNFPGVFDGLYFANSYNLTVAPRKKSDLCKELGITLLVEGDMDYVKECSEAGLATLLFDQPWNQGDLPPNTKRVFSWDEIVAEISKGKNFSE